jgi:hypothetical protein
MKYYILRDDKGVMKAAITAQSAKEIFAQVDGKWRAYNTKTASGRAYEITVDAVWTVMNRMRIYLWQGDVLVEAEVPV